MLPCHYATTEFSKTNPGAWKFFSNRTIKDYEAGKKMLMHDVQYSLGILPDDDLHYNNNNLIEQYFQRPSLLQAFGWKVMAVYAKDWLENKEKVIAGLKRALNNETIVVQQIIVATHAVEEKKDDGVITLVSEAEGKFVSFGLEGSSLVVRTGKLGTKGFAEVREFESEELARSEMERLREVWMGKVIPKNNNSALLRYYCKCLHNGIILIVICFSGKNSNEF